MAESEDQPHGGRGKRVLKATSGEAGTSAPDGPSTQSHHERLFKTITSDSREAEINNHPFEWELVPLPSSKSSKQRSPSRCPPEVPQEHGATATWACFGSVTQARDDVAPAVQTALLRNALTLGLVLNAPLSGSPPERVRLTNCKCVCLWVSGLPFVSSEKGLDGPLRALDAGGSV